MKKLAVSFILLSMLGLAAAATALAGTVSLIEAIDPPITEAVNCANGGAGEDVIVTGNVHVLISTTINDNRVSMWLQVNPQGAVGVGQTTGDTYRGTGVTRYTFEAQSLVNDQARFPFLNNFLLVGPGPGNNFRLHQNIQLTVNANGEVTAEGLNNSITCK